MWPASTCGTRVISRLEALAGRLRVMREIVEENVAANTRLVRLSLALADLALVSAHQPHDVGAVHEPQQQR